MEDITIKIKEISKIFVNTHIDDPSPEDFMLFENAMLISSTKTMKLILKKD